MHGVILLGQEVKELRVANENQKLNRAAPRSYIATGGVLTGAEGRQPIQEALGDLGKPVQKKRAPPRYSNCHRIGHIRTQCPSK